MIANPGAPELYLRFLRHLVPSRPELVGKLIAHFCDSIKSSYWNYDIISSV